MSFTDIRDMGNTKLPQKKEEGQTPRWLKILSDYCEDTTFHGIKHITEHQRYFTRRLVWLLLFLGSSSIFLLQVATSIEYYLSWPVSVDVKIIYNESIIFPAVTICNKNAFRASEAQRKDYYYFISELFGRKDVHYSPNTENPIEMNLEDLYRTLGHTKEDLIIRCEWNGETCFADDFVTVMTDYGMCYTFNSGENDTPLKLTHQAGSNGGLRLQVNIEQYEYMRGPNTGAGLKILVHNQKEVPLVKDYGRAVPSGSHGYVAVKTFEVNNLEPNHGECNDSVNLTYYDDYAMYNCYTNCKQEYLLQQCGCRDFYMPSKNGFPAACDMETYETCMIPALATFSNVKDCHCPVPCHSLLYEPSVSFASSSNFDVDTLLNGNNSNRFRDKYIVAREVSQRVHKSIIHKDTKLITTFNDTVQTLSKLLLLLHQDFLCTLSILKESFNTLQDHMSFHMDRGLEAVEFIIDHDFLRGWELQHERAYHYVTADFMGFAQILNRTIASAASKFDLSSNATREWVYFPLRDMFKVKLALLDRAEEYLNETNQAFITGDPLLTYELTLNRTYDMTYITLPLLQDFANEQKHHYTTLLEGIHWLRSGINVLQETGEQFVETGFFNETAFIYGEDIFIKGGRRFNYRLFTYKTRVLDKPLEEIRRRIAEFQVANRTIIKHYCTVERTLKDMNEILNDVLQTTWQDIVNLSEISSAYISNTGSLKTNLSTYVTSFSIHRSIHIIGIFFDDFKIRSRSMYEDIMTLKLAFSDVWSLMLSENSTVKFYEMLYNHTTDFLQSTDQDSYYMELFAHLLRVQVSDLGKLTKQEILDKINWDFHVQTQEQALDKVSQVFDIFVSTMQVNKHIGELDELFLDQFNRYNAAMNEFLQGNEINSDFYRQNVMTLDVYMQELSYQQITQQRAYGISQLVSDIGGSMGLFIGGSVLSIFEFLDIWVHNCFQSYNDVS